MMNRTPVTIRGSVIIKREVRLFQVSKANIVINPVTINAIPPCNPLNHAQIKTTIMMIEGIRCINSASRTSGDTASEKTSKAKTLKNKIMKIAIILGIQKNILSFMRVVYNKTYLNFLLEEKKVN